MSFARQFFGKPLHEVEVSDILRFFKQKRHEGQHLEFKSGEVHMEKIQKEICAFLNSEGGLMIVGAPREMSIPGMVKERSSFGEPRPSNINDPEVFTSKLLSGIVPEPVGMQLQQIRFSDGSVFLVEVPPSSFPPHQLFATGKYYLREGDVSRPAFHEEVERMFLDSRKAYPDLRLEIQKKKDEVTLSLVFSNRSSVSVDKLNFRLEVRPVLHQVEEFFVVEEQLGKPLSRGEEWIQSFRFEPANECAYLKVGFSCEDIPLRQKAAFVKFGRATVELLATFDSESDDFSLEDFYNQHSHLLTS